MTLEDFFTLTEMKDGFTAPAHVKEVITVMQKEKDSLVKSVGEATRQWAAVASTITATENKECLDLFIQLDGLLFIDRWLKDAQTFRDEPSDFSVEEAISSLLLAVEKLQLDRDKLSSSGICITVNGLLSYKSTRVQDKARALCDSWESKDLDFKSVDVEHATAIDDDQKLVNQDHGPQIPANDASPTQSSAHQKLKGAEGKNKLTDEGGSFQIPSNHADSSFNKVTTPAKLESFASDPPGEEVCPSDGIFDSRCLKAPIQGTDGVISEHMNPGLVVEDVKHESKFEMLPDRSGNITVTSTSNVPDSNDVYSNIDAKLTEEAVAKPDVEECDVKDESLVKLTSGCDKNSPVDQSSNEVDDSEQNGQQGDGSAMEESNDQAANTLPRLGDDVEHDELNRYRKNERRYFSKSCDFARLTKSSKTTDIIRQTRDMDLEDGTVDALEVARLVANEVEREVGGYCEQSDSSTSSSSSSERISRGGVRQQDSPKSKNGEREMQVDGPENAPDASNNVPSMTLANLETNTKYRSEDGDSSLTANAVQDPKRNTGRSIWEFDLNEEFCSEDADHVIDASLNPVSVVSASRAVVASEIPAGPLQFEGCLGWKGSAATSAFRPASPRRASDSDRDLSCGATNSGSRQRQDIINFDLNVVEGMDDKIVNPVLDKQKQVLSILPSGESSVELSPKRSQRHKLDLNQTNDDDMALPAIQWKMGGQVVQPRNCHRSLSPASSSSCLQPSVRNFDLNDNLFNCNDSSDPPVFLRESSHKVNSCMGPPDDAVISILGTKVKRNAFLPQTPLPCLNGRASEPLMDSSLLRGGPVMGFATPTVPYSLGFNGLAMGSAVSLASAQIYRPGGPLPYVFDSRGTPFMPQMLGSATTVPPSYCQPSLVTNMMGTTPGHNLAGPLRTNLDLNSGFANVVETGNSDPVFFRPLYIPHGQIRQSEEQLSLRDSFRPLDSGSNGGKRKEPDTGWDFYPTNYKNQSPHF